MYNLTMENAHNKRLQLTVWAPLDFVLLAVALKLTQIKLRPACGWAGRYSLSPSEYGTGKSLY